MPLVPERGEGKLAGAGERFGEAPRVLAHRLDLSFGPAAVISSSLSLGPRGREAVLASIGVRFRGELPHGVLCGELASPPPLAF